MSKCFRAATTPISFTFSSTSSLNELEKVWAFFIFETPLCCLFSWSLKFLLELKSFPQSWHWYWTETGASSSIETLLLSVGFPKSSPILISCPSWSLCSRSSACEGWQRPDSSVIVGSLIEGSKTQLPSNPISSSESSIAGLFCHRQWLAFEPLAENHDRLVAAVVTNMGWNGMGYSTSCCGHNSYDNARCRWSFHHPASLKDSILYKSEIPAIWLHSRQGIIKTL